MDRNCQIRTKGNRYSPYAKNKALEDTSLLKDLTQCFKDPSLLEGPSKADIESEDIFSEEDFVDTSGKVKSLATKTSQYKREVLESFDQLETTICHLNEDIFKENIPNNLNVTSKTLPGNDSVWEKSFFDNKDASYDVRGPNNLTQLLVSNIEDGKKSSRTPLLPGEYSGSFYGLPELAKSLVFQYKGIDKLYDWQHECLTLAAVKQRKNLVYALPTSGGKTLVAEILMLREIVCRKKCVLFVLPFVSIVQEKVWGLSPFAVGLDFLVEEYAAGKGMFPPRKRRKRKSIYVSTMEKGLSLVRSFMELGRLGEIGLIVIDELHMLGEATRGCILELLLTNVMHSKEDIQIIGMSATIGNINELAKFLNAEIFLKDFRPVELKEFIKFGSNILKVNPDAKSDEDRIILERKIDYGYSAQIEKLDPDHLGGLVMEVIPNGSCLVFCPTKKNCENVATLLSKVVFKTLLNHQSIKKAELVESLKAEGTTDEILFSLIPWGLAYHHSGLSSEERRLIEDGFREGVLSVLCCTSTLAAGVNLPAQRVILRAPLVSKDFISLSTYKQMVGRAGRAGFGGYGDSILICPSHLKDKVLNLFNSPMDKVSSNLHINDGANMRSLILGAIALNTANTRKTLRKLIDCTLLSVQSKRLDTDVKVLLDSTIETLLKMGAINTKETVVNKGPALDISDNMSVTQHTRQLLKKNSRKTKSIGDKHIKITNDTELVISRLGKAAVKGSIELQRAHMLYADLKVAQNSLVVVDILHLLYLITPYDLSENIKPDLLNYSNIYTNLNDECMQTARVIGITEAVAMQMTKRKISQSISERVLNRFYVTLILYDLWNQKSLVDTSEKFQVNKGMLQSLMLGAATFGSSVLRFCEELEEFWAFKELLSHVSLRLSHFCTHELVPLMELPSVKKSRAVQLYKAGFKTIQDVAKAKPIDLMESLEHVNRNVANQLIAAAKLLLLERVENLREEAEEVIEGLNTKSDRKE